MFFLIPGIKLMGRLTYLQKFSLISLVFLLPLMALLWSTMSQLHANAVKLEHEQEGLLLLGSLRPLVENLAKHRGMSNALLNGDDSFAPKVAKQKALVDGYMAALSDDKVHWQNDGLWPQAQALQETWQKVRDINAVPAPQGFQRHSDLIAQVIDLGVNVADRCELTTTSNLGVYYLVDAITARLPIVVENLGQLRGKGSGIAAKGEVSVAASLALTGLSKNIEAAERGFKHGMSELRQSQWDNTNALLADADQAGQSLTQYLAFINQELIERVDESTSVEPAKVFKFGTQVISEHFKVYDQALEVLDSHLTYEIQKDYAIITMLWLAVAAGLLVIAYLYTAFYQSVRGSIADIVTASKALGEGNLTAKVKNPVKDETGDIANAFNHLSQRFNGIFTELTELSLSLKGDASSVAQLAETTNASVQGQLQQVQKMVAAITEMNASAQEIANHTTQANDATNTTMEAMRHSSEQMHKSRQGTDKLTADMQKAVDVMAGMAKESSNIGQVLDVIKGIAEQTNLLALNAAIEAARAGEQGRGFAVVADEVRTLAQRTHESTEEIQTMIQSLQSISDEAVQVIEQSHQQVGSVNEQSQVIAEALNSSCATMEQLHDMIAGIARAAEEQTNVCEEVNKNIVAVDDVTQDIAKGAQSANGLGQNLSDKADKLSYMVQAFTLH